MSKAEPATWISGDLKSRCWAKFWLSSYSTHIHSQLSVKRAYLWLQLVILQSVLGPSLSYDILTHFYICSFEISYCLLFYFATIACFVSPFNPFLSHLAPAFLALISAAEILCLVFEVNKICLSLRILHYLVSSFYLFIFVSTGYRLYLHFLFVYCIRWRDQRRKQAVDP